MGLGPNSETFENLIRPKLQEKKKDKILDYNLTHDKGPKCNLALFLTYSVYLYFVNFPFSVHSPHTLRGVHDQI